MDAEVARAHRLSGWGSDTAIATLLVRGCTVISAMRAKGVVYDTGFIYAGGTSREQLAPGVVARELRIIRDDLHCNAVRITGGDADRLELAGSLAADLGLEVWFSPFTGDQTTDELLTLVSDCADRAERLRRQGAQVVFVTGAELSLLTKGFLPGDTLPERLSLLRSRSSGLLASIAEVPPRVNAFLRSAVASVRARFGGRVTYASVGRLEDVDWTPFDIVSLDVYRSAEVADRFGKGMHALVAEWRERGKPVAITEFGCTTHRGAADKGATGGDIVVWDGAKAVGLDGDYTRDEVEQATCLRELVDIFSSAGIDSAFVFTFAACQLPHRTDSRADLDMASYGVVKVLEDRDGQTYPGLAWEPKLAFHAVAEAYLDCRGRAV